MASQPLVSIVMPSFNQAGFIEQAITSVLSQSWPRLELIVQDGGSTDGTQALLANINAKDARLRWASEPDAGPAEAINKALAQAKGTYIGWLNSDDCYTQGAIERALNALQANPNWLLCYGQGQHIDANGQSLGLYPTKPKLAPTNARPGADRNARVPPAQAFQQGCFICQPTVFFKAVVPRLLGKLDTELKASFDFDYWLRAFNAFPGRIGYVPAIQACSRLHESTITHGQRLTVALEGISVLAKHQGSAPSHWLISYMKEQQQQDRSPQSLQQELRRLQPEVNPKLAPRERALLERAIQQLEPAPESTE